MVLASPPRKELDLDKDEIEAKRCASEEKSLLSNEDVSDGEGVGQEENDEVEGKNEDDQEDDEEDQDRDDNDDDEKFVVESMLTQTQQEEMSSEDSVEEETKCVQALNRGATMFTKQEGEEIETLGDMPDPVTAEEPELVTFDQEQQVFEEESK